MDEPKTRYTFTDGSLLTLAAGHVVTVTSDSTVNLGDADTATHRVIGVCDATDGTNAEIMTYGIRATQSDNLQYNAGDILYLSQTAGKVTKTPPTASGTIIQVVGLAKNTASGNTIDMIINPELRVIVN